MSLDYHSETLSFKKEKKKTQLSFWVNFMSTCLENLDWNLVHFVNDHTDDLAGLPVHVLLAQPKAASCPCSILEIAAGSCAHLGRDPCAYLPGFHGPGSPGESSGMT